MLRGLRIEYPAPIKGGPLFYMNRKVAAMLGSGCLDAAPLRWRKRPEARRQWKKRQADLRNRILGKARPGPFQYEWKPGAPAAYYGIYIAPTPTLPADDLIARLHELTPNAYWSRDEIERRYPKNG